jgi:DNA-binding NarL/FixJ family response regulator
MVKIALVDDHTLFRNGLKGLLRTNSDYEVVGDYADGSQFIAALPELDVDIVFMDIAMPNMDGQRATILALQQRPELKIIALTMFSEQPYAQQMIEAGVCGYINKDSDIQIVFDAVNSVMSGGKYFPQGVVEPRKLNEIDDFDALSDRELAVLTAICQGLSTPQIADLLEISKRTVDTHRARILEKTGCNNTASLVAYAIKNKLVEV